MEFYVPPAVRKQADSDRQASVEGDSASQDELKNIIKSHNEQSMKVYQTLLDKGVAREQARGVLPQNMMVTFWGTVDLNNLLHFLELRDDTHAQWEIREYAKAIKKTN